MSKIITKKQLDLVMESTLKEADYMMEAKDELKITKSHMDELHKEGHCMCDNKCLVYIEDISGDVKKTTELMQKLASEKMDCVFITKEQMDMLHKDGKCDCDDNVSLSYDDEMKEGDYMDNMEDNMCSECGGGMSEGKCNECGDGMSEDKKDKPDFLDLNNNGDKEEPMKDAAKDAEEKEVTEITVGETKYKVVEESVNKLTEALYKNIDKKVIKEEMDFFNKIIKY